MKRYSVSISFSASSEEQASEVQRAVEEVVKQAEASCQVSGVEISSHEEVSGSLQLPENVEGDTDDQISLTFDEIFVPDADRF